jgi:hypothetical protein
LVILFVFTITSLIEFNATALRLSGRFARSALVLARPRVAPRHTVRHYTEEPNHDISYMMARINSVTKSLEKYQSSYRQITIVAAFALS